MLRLHNITKNYKVADTYVPALKGIDLNFRKCEFVSILGPSGCGKTTLLNIIGGLDKYTAGDLFIGGVSTKNFKDHDWDVYRNHKIGFIFQSYNLIPHQTILGNVELALTISGIGKKERQERAKRALDKVGLKGQYHKRPNQLSGGQCQRVAIARALVNEPSILLADEPTGALDTVTSVQIMDLIKEISKEKLVIMVTHNPDLAEKYSTRIVRLLDGELQEDSMPFSSEEEIEECKVEKAAEEERTGDKKQKKDKAKMSLWTAFKLSGRNLISKAKRTIMVAIAGCIGIVGISAVLSVSNGVQGYVNNMENDMLSGNPVYISQSALDISTVMGGGASNQQTVNPNNDTDSVYVNSSIQDLYHMSGALTTNTIDKEYLDYIKKMPEGTCELVKYEYGYKIAPNLYTTIKTNTGSHKMSISAIQALFASVIENVDEFKDYASLVSGFSVMSELPSKADYIASQYDIVYMEEGKTFEELMDDKSTLIAVVSKGHNTMDDLQLAEYGFFSQEEFLNYCFKISGNDRYVDNDLINIPETISYQALANKTFTWYPNDTIYRRDNDSDGELGDKYYVSAYSDGTLANDADAKFKNSKYAFNAFTNGLDLNVKCVLKLKENLSYGCLSSGEIYYTGSLSDYMREQNYNSSVCQSARSGGGSLYNIEMGYKFKADNDSVTDLETSYLSSDGNSIMSYFLSFMGAMSDTKNVMTYSGSALGADEFPSTLSFYCKDFEQKDKLTDYLDVWNDTVAANTYKTDKYGYYIGKETVDGVEKTVRYYYSEKTGKYYRVQTTDDGYAVDIQGNKYLLVVDKDNNDSGFYQKKNDTFGTEFTLDDSDRSTIRVNDAVSVNAYTLASYIIFGKEFPYEENEYVLNNVEGRGDNLFCYERADGEKEYVMKVKNKSFYKLALDKDGNVLATQNGYGKYRYDEATDTFYLDKYREEIIQPDPADPEQEPTVRYVLESTAVTDRTVLYADSSVYPYANVVKYPKYTFNDTEYTFDTKGLYVDMTQIDFSQVVVDFNTNIARLRDYSGIDFYYLDAEDQGETYYYVKYVEETKKDGTVVGYLCGNNLSSYLNATSLSDNAAYNTEQLDAFVSDKYRINADGSLQAVKVNIDRSAPLSGKDMMEILLGEELTDLSVLEADTSKKITYTDSIGLIITMVNTLIQIITYALIAFTALSLLVSTVMIGIITYVSVVERTKEIGVIRALGGRKMDVSHLFNAETFIIGLVAGLFGIGITYIIDAIINAVIGSLTGIFTIASFPFWQAAIMVGLSVTLTLLSGILPSRSAAKKDPVVALRTE